MKTLQKHLQEHSKNMIPYTPLTTVELIEYTNAVKEWLQEHQIITELDEYTAWQDYHNQIIKKLIEELEQ